MSRYEQYIQTTKYWLYAYERMRKECSQLKSAYRELEREIADYSYVAAPVAKYGGKSPTASGYRTTSPVENALAQREGKVRELQDLGNDISKCEDIIGRVDASFAEMGEDEREIIHRHYFHHESWKSMANTMGKPEKALARKGANTVGKMALMIFGSRELLDRYSDY